MNVIEATNSEKFAAGIRKSANENGINLIDAITSYCEDNDIMIEDVLPLIDSNLKEEIRLTAINNRYILGEQKVATLF